MGNNVDTGIPYDHEQLVGMFLGSEVRNWLSRQACLPYGLRLTAGCPQRHSAFMTFTRSRKNGSGESGGSDGDSNDHNGDPGALEVGHDTDFNRMAIVDSGASSFITSSLPDSFDVYRRTG